jgi:Flp pilus assembly protein TadD
MRKLAVVLAFVAAIVGCWFYFQSRAITVWLFTDISFRANHTDWPALVESRFKEVNRIFLRNRTGIRWKVVNASETDPTSKINGIDNRRANMIFHVDNRADVFVVLTGVQEGGRTGSVGPFTRVAVVVDFPQKSETLNGRLLAHELTQLFGAPSDPAWQPESNSYPPKTLDLIRRMRNYPFALGIDGLAQGSWEKRALAAVAEDDTRTHTNPLAHAHTVLGTALLNERKGDAALVHLRQAAQADPNNPRLRLNLAEAYTRNGQDQEALREGREVVRLAPHDALSHRALGALLGRTHQPEEALKELQIAAQMDPQNAETQVLIGAELGSMFGRIDEAIAVLQEALRLDPNASQASKGLEQLQALKQRVADELVKERGRIQQDPADSQAHYLLAKAEARAGDLAGAIREFEKASTLRPDNGTVHSELAEVYSAQGDFVNAWAEVRKARALGAEPPAALIARLPAQQ